MTKRKRGRPPLAAKVPEEKRETAPVDPVFRERADKIHEMVLYGYAKHQIVAYCARTWGIDEDAAKALIADSNRRMRELARAEREVERGKAVGRLEIMLRKSFEVSDIGKALSSQQELNRLQSLYDAPAPTTTNIRLTDLSDEELQKLVGDG